MEKSKRWFARFDGYKDPKDPTEYVAEIIVGSGRATPQCLCIRWYRLESQLVPSLEVFNDSWGALTREFVDVLNVLASLDGPNVTPSILATSLRALGFADRTRQHLRRAARLEQELRESVKAGFADRTFGRIRH